MKNKKLINSFKFAFKGIGSSIKSERNMKIHTTMMLLVIISGIFFNIAMWEWITCFILFGLVISLEMVNTAYGNSSTHVRGNTYVWPLPCYGECASRHQTY